MIKTWMLAIALATAQDAATYSATVKIDDV